MVDVRCPTLTIMKTEDKTRALKSKFAYKWHQLCREYSVCPVVDLQFNEAISY